MIGNRLNTTKWLFIHKIFISNDYNTTSYYGWNAYHQLQPNNILNTDNNNTTYHTIITEKELYKSRLAKLSKIVIKNKILDAEVSNTKREWTTRTVLDLDSNTIWNWDIETRILLYRSKQLLMPQIWETKQKST